MGGGVRYHVGRDEAPDEVLGERLLVVHQVAPDLRPRDFVFRLWMLIT